MEKKISVIIPCYNAEEFIDRCVASVVSQSIGIENLEVILVDDASTDGTKEKLFAWEREYPDSVIVVLCTENGKQGTARNIGMRYASAPYITFADDDDFLALEACEKLFAKAEEYQTDVTIGGAVYLWGDNRVQPFRTVGTPVKVEELLVVDSVQKRHEFLKLPISVVPWSRLYRRDFLEKNEIVFMEQLFPEDISFTALVRFTAERIYVVDDFLYFYDRTRVTTASRRNQSYQFEQLQVTLMTIEELCRRGYEKEFHQEIYGYFLEKYYLSSMEHYFRLFDTLPYEVFNEMKKTVLAVFPDYKKSEMYAMLSPLEKGLLESLEVEMTNEKWDLLAQNFLFLMKKADEMPEEAERESFSESS